MRSSSSVAQVYFFMVFTYSGIAHFCNKGSLAVEACLLAIETPFIKHLNALPLFERTKFDAVEYLIRVDSFFQSFFQPVPV